MKVLVTIAHPNPESFNHAILGQFARGLGEAGHTMVLNDLHADYFDPVLNRSELVRSKDAGLSEDILAQQKLVAEAEALVFIHPIWWYGFPAILKGWVDRVLTTGFAYQFGGKGPTGRLSQTRAHFIRTTLGNQKRYAASGMLEALDKSIDTVFSQVCGIDHIALTTFFAVPTDKDLRIQYLEEAYRLGLDF